MREWTVEMSTRAARGVRQSGKDGRGIVGGGRATEGIPFIVRATSNGTSRAPNQIRV
jgi:hypothetical protein